MSNRQDWNTVFRKGSFPLGKKETVLMVYIYMAMMKKEANYPSMQFYYIPTKVAKPLS